MIGDGHPEAGGAVRRPVALVGLRGSGKTTVGGLVARALGRPFVDLDAEVARLANMSVGRLLETRGEAELRRLELCALVAALEDETVVIATGGGTPTRAEARALLRARAIVLYLRLTPELASLRVIADQETHRPPLRQGGPLAEAQALLAERAEAYEAVSHHIVDAAADPLTVAHEVLKTLSLPPRPDGCASECSGAVRSTLVPPIGPK